jgi:hypothetical protein
MDRLIKTSGRPHSNSSTTNTCINNSISSSISSRCLILMVTTTNLDRRILMASHNHNPAMEWLIILHQPHRLNINNISLTTQCSQHKTIHLPLTSEHPFACIRRQSLNLLLLVALQPRRLSNNNNSSNIQNQ